MDPKKQNVDRPLPFPYTTVAADENRIDTTMIAAAGSSEFSLLCSFLAASSVIVIDVQRMPVTGEGGTLFSFIEIAIPTVSLPDWAPRTHIFFLDLQSLSLDDVSDLMRTLLEDPDVLKIGRNFKLEFSYFSSILRANGRGGFVRLQSFLDTTTIYHYYRKKCDHIASMWEELHDQYQSEAFQFIDWSIRPLSRNTIIYAAKYSHYALQIFLKFYEAIQDMSLISTQFSFNEPIGTNYVHAESAISGSKFFNIVNVMKYHVSLPRNLLRTTFFRSSTYTFDKPVSKSIEKYTEVISLMGFSKDRKASRRLPSLCSKYMNFLEDKLSPPPWDTSLGGDGCPRFLCDHTVRTLIEGLAMDLRLVGIDAAVPLSKMIKRREMLVQAYLEKRIIVTRDKTLLKYKCLSPTHVHRVKSIYKEDQLVEVVRTFKLGICRNGIMSRCLECNIMVDQAKENSTEVKELRRILTEMGEPPDFEVWECSSCSHLSYGGGHFEYLVQKFTILCNLNE